jgi:hypothetical protein
VIPDEFIVGVYRLRTMAERMLDGCSETTTCNVLNAVRDDLARDLECLLDLRNVRQKRHGEEVRRLARRLSSP